MFREMRRKKQEVPREECIHILDTEKRGVIAVIGEKGYPYAIPVNFFYDKQDEKIYIHGAKEGHKIDAIRENDKVCFTVWNQGYQKEDDWAYYVTSVIVFGRAEIVNDDMVTYEKTRSLGLKYYPTAEEVDDEIKRSLNRVQMISINIEHMTGKIVHEK